MYTVNIFLPAKMSDLQQPDFLRARRTSSPPLFL